MDLPAWAQASVGMGLAALVAYLTTPVAIQTARRLAFYDLPVGYKGHTNPTPYLGGTAVIAAFAVAILVGAQDRARTLPLVIAVAAMLVLGTIDDRRTVSPVVRLAIEFVIGALLSIDGIGWSLAWGGAVDAVLTGVWVVGVVNAFNLFDNMDGQASTMAAVVSGGAAVLALVAGDVWVAAGSATLCGACLGFLPHNLSSPARIFLGDGGSLPIGLAAAVLVANAAQAAQPSALCLLVGFLLVGIPALDTTLVVVSRTRRGVPIVTAGRDHLTHRARLKLGTPPRVAVVLGSIQALLSAIVIFGTRASASLMVYIVLTFVVCAAGAIIALEEAIAEPGAPAEIEDPHATAVRPPRRSQRAHWTRWFPDACLAIIGLGAGISPFFAGYFDVGVWVPLGLVLVVAAAMALVARPPAGTRPLLLAFGGLAGIGVWSMLSTLWADNAEAAGLDANLWLTYAAMLLLVVILLRGGGRSRTVLIAALGGIAIVGASVLIRLLGSDSGSLFAAGRLDSPLGYVNGEGCVFAMAVWPAVALAERARALLAGAGAAAAVAFAELALMSQSRGAAIATGVTLVALLALAPGFRRRALALAVIAAGTAAAVPAVVRIYTIGSERPLPASTAHHAGVAVLIAALAVGVVWAAVVALGDAVRRAGGRPAQLARRAATVAAVAVVAAPVLLAVVRFSPIEHTVRRQWHAFVDVSAMGTAGNVPVRLLSGAGDRYDYWRVAWNTFTSHPLGGIGAGNYPVAYYRDRRTDESIENPHSLELQTLSELGIVGLGLLLLFGAGAAAGAVGLRRSARASPAARTTLVAVTGMFGVWLVDTSGDWMHLIPGVTAIALCAVAALCGRSSPAPIVRPSASGRRLWPLAGAVAATVVLAIAGASLLRAGAARYYLDRARTELAADPRRAIVNSQRVLRIDDDDLDAYYVEAAGQARFDLATQARDTLLQATREAPESFVTWTLLGDLETRAGQLSLARGYYRRAHDLDPRDPGLTILAVHPQRGLRAGS